MLKQLDHKLRFPAPREALCGGRRFLWEFWYFGIKEARACLFAGLFFAAVFLLPSAGLFGIPKYDCLLIWALGIQAWMLISGLETWDELKAICLFHAVGFALEVFKTHPAIGSWSYPGEGFTKLFGVPLFSGFMYAAVGSYMIQAWRLMHLRIVNHPPYWLAWAVAIGIYANFFTHHFLPDVRWYLAAFACGLYARTYVVFRPLDRDRRMPLALAMILIGFFVWLAENISTFFAVWSYPDQLGAWSAVHAGKWGAWSLLVVMTFTIITNLKHLRQTIHVVPRTDPERAFSKIEVTQAQAAPAVTPAPGPAHGPAHGPAPR